MLAALLGALLAGTACFRLDSFMFGPLPADEYLNPDDFEPKWRVEFIIPDSLYREVELVSSGGNLIYGFLVEPASGAPRDGATILYCHGNGENINRYWGRVELLWKMGYRVFIFDYQGYGKSQGAPSGAACYADGRAALDYLLSLPEVDTSRIVYYGWSLGAFVCTWLSAEVRPAAAIVLESAPASADVLVREGTLFAIPGSFLTELDFDNVGRIPDVGADVLLLHGVEDDYLAVERHARPIIRAAEGHIELRAALVDEAGHEDIPYVLGARYAELITTLVQDKTGR